MPRIITFLLLVTMGLGGTPVMAVGGDHAVPVAEPQCGCSSSEDTCRSRPDESDRTASEPAPDCKDEISTPKRAGCDSSDQDECCPTGCNSCFRSCCAGLLILQPNSLTLSPGRLVRPHDRSVIGAFTSLDPADIFHPPRS